MNGSLSVPVTIRLPFSTASVSVARQKLRTWLADSEIACEAIEDARVVVSELVANSLRHAEPLSDGSIVVSWIQEGGGVLVSVTDGGSGTRPRNVHASSSAPAGRGMALVEVLSQSWWAERTSSRSTVHALLHV